MVRTCMIPALLFALLSAAAWPAWAEAPGGAERGFVFEERPGEGLDVRLDGRLAARYMTAFDNSTPDRRHETYKTYLHVFNAEGTTPITKGLGGLFPHHRGIFIGWSRLKFDGKSYDFWGMGGGQIVHQRYLKQEAGPDEAVFTSLCHWIDAAGEPIVVEERTTALRRAPEPARMIVDLLTTLTAPRGEVVLDGDPEHAGVQYRPANELDTTQTTYTFPGEKANPKADLDYPWVGATYLLGGNRYSVVAFNQPENPKNTRFSAYRDYGRFGAFCVATIKPGESLRLKYRFLIADGPMPPVEMIQRCWDDFAGAATPSAVPPVTVLLSDQPAKK